MTTVGAVLIARITERRADEREQKRFKREAEARQRAIAEEVAVAFLRELNTVRRYSLTGGHGSDVPLEVTFEEAWLEKIEMRLRHDVDRLADELTRRRLQMVVDAVNDHLVQSISGYDYDRFIAWLFDLGRAFAMAVVRGQDPDPGMLADYERLDSWTRAAQEYRTVQREAAD